MEILVPVKNKEAALIAINLKADAIYCSGPMYSARKDAAISFDDLKYIVKYAHLYNTRVYITLNTMIKEQIANDVYKYIDQLIKLNIDAIIIQDLGLLNYLNKTYPNQEIHASTQMHLHNAAGVTLVNKYGIKRAVLARELSIKDIKDIKEKNKDVELEIFVHGALCTSYSGQCYYGAFYNLGSGNLGTCEQNCRKKHSFNNKNNNLLSLKDLALQKDIMKLQGFVDSLKIEGRLKSKEYLYSTTKYYQNILANNEDCEMLDLMQIAFNRTYTKGRMFLENGKKIVNSKRVNNHGLYVGSIIDYNHNFLTIKLEKTLHRLDNIRVVNNNQETGWCVEKIYEENKEVNKASKKIIKIKNRNNINYKGDVFIVKTRAYENVINEYTKEYVSKIELKLDVLIKIDEYIEIKIKDKKYYSNFKVQKANKQPMKLADIQRQLAKVNDTCFSFNIIINKESDDEVFIVKSQLNEFKRTIIEQLVSEKIYRTKIDKTNCIQLKNKDYKFVSNKYMIKTIEQAKVLRSFNIKEVYLTNLDIIKEIKALFETVVIVLPRIIKQDNFKKYINIVSNEKRVMVSELGMLESLKNKSLETNFSFNIANLEALDFLKKQNVINSVLSLESDNAFHLDGITSTKMVYGYYPLMIMDYCPINEFKYDDCQSCQMCLNKQYHLFNDKNQKLPLVYAYDNILELYSDKPYNNINKIQAQYHLYNFTIENESETKKILEKAIMYEKAFVD